jgi:hypothetical protein
MAEISGDHTAEQLHCDAFMRENADLDIRRPAHNLEATPLRGLLTTPETETVSVRRSIATITTRCTSFDVWAALTSLEDLLSDYRRIAPHYGFTQTAGEAAIVAGNEYRLTLWDPALLDSLNSAIGSMTSDQKSLPGIEQRIMDVRVVRAGPWGGETGELVVEALRNHALAGASSLWVLAHDGADDGNMRVTLDAIELAFWAWAPDLIAGRQRPSDSTGARIMDWDYLFERLAEKLDGLAEQPEPGGSFSKFVETKFISQDDQIIESLKLHGGLMPYVNQMKLQ